MIKVAAISDLHGKWNRLGTYPDIDLVIVVGDICKEDDYQSQAKEMPYFLESLPSIFPGYPKIIIVPGNHDFWLERHYQERLGFGIEVLVRQETEFQGLRIYGDPYTQSGPFWAFQGDIQEVPEGLDILITHDSPRFYSLQCVKNSIGDYGKEEPGNLRLAKKIMIHPPKYHIFGHIHKPCEWDNGITQFYNVSSPEPTILEIPDFELHTNT